MSKVYSDLLKIFLMLKFPFSEISGKHLLEFFLVKYNLIFREIPQICTGAQIKMFSDKI